MNKAEQDNKGEQLDVCLDEELEQYYEGYWHLGVKEGIGFYYMAENSFCFGDIKNGVLHGYGKFCIN
jgi:hypothetical protein